MDERGSLIFCAVYPRRRRTFAEINAELDFLAYLHSQGRARIDSGSAAQRGRLLTLQAPEGTRDAVLFTYAQGEPLGENLAVIQHVRPDP